ncbi:MAG: ParB/RepB/Spo0J family partition protein [Phycisphaerae bacterium]|nr:ParB/RepB/Spo0J family partition protein [Phycisphaerae bacterium]
MAKPTRRLGRGIASLLGEAALPESALQTTPTPGALTRELPVRAITPNPHQPRTDFDPERLEELAASIRATGVIQPIVVRPSGTGYQLVAGERRWRATQQAGLSTIPAVVREVSDQQMVEFALIENIQREDLNPLDRAVGYKQCCDRFGLTAESLAGHLGEDRSTVANYIRLLELPEAVQQLLRGGALSMGHARCLLGLGNPRLMEQLAQETVAEGHSVRHLEAAVRSRREEPSATPAAAPAKPKKKRPLIEDLEQRFAEALQTRVSIKEGRKKNTGKIVITYFSLDDFDRVAERLGVDLEEI